MDRVDSALRLVIEQRVQEPRALLSLVNSLKTDSGSVRGFRGVFSDFALALRTMRKEGKIKRLQQSLEDCKNNLRLLIAERTMWAAEYSW